jgi:hypothetical protein
VYRPLPGPINEIVSKYKAKQKFIREKAREDLRRENGASIRRPNRIPIIQLEPIPTRDDTRINFS